MTKGKVLIMTDDIRDLNIMIEREDINQEIIEIETVIEIIEDLREKEIISIRRLAKRVN